MQRSLGKLVLIWLGGAFLAASASAAQAPLEQLKSLSILQSPDLARLKEGEIVIESGPLGDFQRGVHLQSCYLIQAPLQAVGHALLHGNPIQQKDPDVFQYREYAFPGSAADFKKLRLDQASGNDRWLLEQTARIGRGASDLHLSKEETDLLRKKTSTPSEAWQEILERRSRALARGGMKAVAPFGANPALSPASEFNGLLSLAPKAAQFFRPIVSAKPVEANGRPASKVVAYWEAAKVRDHTTLQLGFVAAQEGTNSWQVINCVYYPSDTYFMSFDLYQLWPVEGATLVWQVGLVSAPFRTYLGGADRFVAGKLMKAEMLDTIKRFRASLEKRR